MTRDWTLSDQADAADDKAHREWWRKASSHDQFGENDMDRAASCPDCGDVIDTGGGYVLAAEEHDGSPCPTCVSQQGAPV